MKNTNFSHPFPWKSTPGFIFQMLMLNSAYLKFKAQKIQNIKCHLYINLLNMYESRNLPYPKASNPKTLSFRKKKKLLVYFPMLRNLEKIWGTRLSTFLGLVGHYGPRPCNTYILNTLWWRRLSSHLGDTLTTTRGLALLQHREHQTYLWSCSATSTFWDK